MSDQIVVYPLYLVTPVASQKLLALRAKSAALAACLPELTHVDVLYRPASDMAIFVLSVGFAKADADLRDRLSAVASQAASSVVDTATLGATTRERFYNDYLPLFDVVVRHIPDLPAALHRLAQHLQGNTTLEPMPLPGRFRRGDSWHAGRLLSLTRDAVVVATPAPPRLGDTVLVDLGVPGQQVSARVNVIRLADGSPDLHNLDAGFVGRFAPETGDETRRLEAFLAVAAGEGRGFTPPPHRSAPRFPVRLLVTLLSSFGAPTYRALDVSRRGLFLGADRPMAPRGAAVRLLITLDDKGPPIQAVGRVARILAPHEAQPRGIPTGMGIELGSLSREESGRFDRYLARVARRAACHVAVSAPASRLNALVEELSAAGYAASGVADLAALARRVANERAPDLVILDSVLELTNVSTDAARRLLESQHVPVLSVDRTSPEGVRLAADHRLLAA